MDFWTDDREADLIRFVVDGVEYKDAAKVLGVSVGSICGKVARLRKQGRILTEMRQPTTSAPPKGAKGPMAKRAPKFTAQPGCLKIIETQAQEAIEKAATLLTFEERGELIEKGMAVCSFVVGNPSHGQRCFCSSKRRAFSPYCDEHHARCFPQPELQSTKTEVKELEAA